MATFSQGIELVSVVKLSGLAISYTIPSGHYGKVSWSISSFGAGKSTLLLVEGVYADVVFSGTSQISTSSGLLTANSGSFISGSSSSDGAGGLFVGIEIYKNP